jgi:hypothetical protein
MPTAAAHLRRGRLRRSEQHYCRNEHRRNGKKATHNYIVNPNATGWNPRERTRFIRAHLHC